MESSTVPTIEEKATLEETVLLFKQIKHLYDSVKKTKEMINVSDKQK